MRMPSLLLMSLLVGLAGCQPEASAPQGSDAPVVAMPMAAPVESVAQPSASEVVPSAPVEKTVSPVKEQAAVPPPQAKPAPVAVMKPAPAVPAQAVPAVAEPKPEVKPGAALSEADALALAKKSGCLVCHAIDRKVVGPAWKDVAAKYRGDAGAEARLMDKIAKGGSGAWGSMAMPAHPKVGEADRRALAHFVLSLK